MLMFQFKSRGRKKTGIPAGGSRFFHGGRVGGGGAGTALYVVLFRASTDWIRPNTSGQAIRILYSVY
jgi:hypothetical protein